VILGLHLILFFKNRFVCLFIRLSYHKTTTTQEEVLKQAA